MSVGPKRGMEDAINKIGNVDSPLSFAGQTVVAVTLGVLLGYVFNCLFLHLGRDGPQRAARGRALTGRVTHRVLRRV